MDRFKEIEAFVLAMEHRSLAAAALHAGITPVMLGRRIDALERRLGTQLIHRSTRRLALTDQGAGFLDECRTLLALRGMGRVARGGHAELLENCARTGDSALNKHSYIRDN